MPTVWQRKPVTDHTYLLANGEIMPEPQVERTSTGRKVRIVGREASSFAREEVGMILVEVGKRAENFKTRFWMPVDLDERAIISEAGFDPAEVRGTFDPSPQVDRHCLAWWSFKHPTLPIQALLFVTWERYGYRVTDTSHQVTTKLVLQKQLPSMEASAVTESSADFNAISATLSGDHDIRNAFDSWIDAEADREAMAWADDLFADRQDMLERTAVQTLLARIRTAEGLDEIAIPDLRNRADKSFDWLTLKIDGTNVNGQMLADMADYLDGDSTVEKALELYKELVSTLRRSGMVLNNSASANQFLEAMTTGSKEALTLTLGPVVTSKGDSDPRHHLSVHLPTGTFSIACSVNDSTRAEVAHAWEESLVIAELTGKQDVLLAYASEYVRTQHHRTTQKIIAERKSAFGNN